MPKRSKIILEVWNGSAWVPVYRRSSGDENAIINLQIKEKLGHPVMARFSLINRPVTTSAVRGYVEQTYGAYLEEFDRIRLVESYTKAIIFYGRVYRQEVKQDMSYGSLINITAFDALQELRENVLQGQEANLTSTSTVSSAITKIINTFSYNTRVGSNLVSSNISVADTQKFNTSVSSTADNPNFSSGNETALTAIYKLAAKDPHSATASDTEPDSDFGYNYFVDSGFTSADAATTHANAKPAFNYFKRETIPAISPANYYNITYKGTASDGDLSNSYVTTTNTFSEFDFSKQYTDVLTHALITYSKDDGTQDTLTAVQLNVSAISNGAGGNLAFGTLLDGVSIQKSPKLWRRETASGVYESVGQLIYIDSVSGSGVAVVKIYSSYSAYDLLQSTLSAGVYDNYLYVDPNEPTSTNTNRFQVSSTGSSASELVRQKEYNYDSVEKADDVRRAIAAHFTKKTESTKPIRGLVQIPEYPMARMTVDPTGINTGTNVLTLPINVLDRGVRKGMLVRQVAAAGYETGNYGYISDVTTSPDTITVQLYDSSNSTTSWSVADKCLIFVPIRPGFRVQVTNTLANISGTGVVLDLDYSEGVGVQTAAMNIVINNTAAIYSDVPNPTQTGTAYSPNNIPSSTKPIRTTCVFSNTGTNQVNWAAGNLYIGADEYAIDAGNQGSLSTSSWSIVYWLSSDDGGDDTIFSVASSLTTLPQKAVKVARIKAGDSQAQWEFFAGTTQNPQFDLGDSTIFTGNLGVDLFADGAKPFTTNVTWSGGTGASYNQVTNSSGTLNYADGTTLSVTGNTHTGLADSSNQYFYVDTTSGTVSVTTTGSAAIGSNKILLAIAGISNSSDQATPTILPINTKTPIISATALTANAVTADKIEANAVTADKIQANAVTADKIQADAVTADKIQADAVTADKLEATLTLSTTVAAGGGTVVLNPDGILIDSTADPDTTPRLRFENDDTTTAATAGTIGLRGATDETMDFYSPATLGSGNTDFSFGRRNGAYGAGTTAAAGKFKANFGTAEYTNALEFLFSTTSDSEVTFKHNRGNANIANGGKLELDGFTGLTFATAVTSGNVETGAYGMFRYSTDGGGGAADTLAFLSGQNSATPAAATGESSFWTMLSESDGSTGSRLHFEPIVDYSTSAGSDNFAYIGYHNPLMAMYPYYIVTGDGSNSFPSHTFWDDNNTGFYRIASGHTGYSDDGTLRVNFGGHTRTTIDSSGASDRELEFSVQGTLGASGYAYLGSAFPWADDISDIGSPTRRWDNIYATNTTISTSDVRAKENIATSTLGLDFINDLNPVSYQWKSKKDNKLNQTHYGIIAQEVIETLKKHGIDSIENFGGIMHNGDDEDYYGARYSEFVPILMKAIQELSAEVKELKEKK